MVYYYNSIYAYKPWCIHVNVAREHHQKVHFSCLDERISASRRLIALRLNSYHSFTIDFL